MVIDTSALIACIQNEPEAERISVVLSKAGVRLMSAVNWFEMMMVVESRHPQTGVDLVEAALSRLDVQIVPFDRRHMEEAREAWRRFGKGRHPAGLNMADCAAYATAVLSGEALLFKGDGFSRTGIPAVEW
jgi:ribonuclease VapC